MGIFESSLSAAVINTVRSMQTLEDIISLKLLARGAQTLPVLLPSLFKVKGEDQIYKLLFHLQID